MHCHAAQHSALGGTEQRPAPVNQSAQGLLTMGHTWSAAAEQVQSMAEPLQQTVDRDSLDLGCGEFQRQRQTVKTVGQLRDRRQGLFIELERRIGGLSATAEEIGRITDVLV